MRLSFTATILAILMTVSALAAGLPGAPDPAPIAMERAVIFADASAVQGFGFAVVDDYGSFVTADVPLGTVSTIAAMGLAAVPMDATTGRGAVRYDGRAGSPSLPEGLGVAETDYRIVQFRGPVKADWQHALAEEARVYEYLPSNGFLVRADRDAAARIASWPEVVHVGAYAPAFKLADELTGATGAVDLTILLYPDADLSAAVSALIASGATLTDVAATEWQHIVKASADAADLPALARVESVSWMEPSTGEITLDNAQASAITQSGTLTGYTLHDKGVTGSSQVASVCDTGVDTTGGSTFTMVHEMYSDGTRTLQLNVPNPGHRKVALYYAPIENGLRGDGDDSDGHGSHTAGTIAGDAPPLGARNKYDGVAYGAKLAVCDITIGGSFQILTDYSNYWKPAYAIGARVNSNSWGSSHTSTYTAVAKMHDEYVWTNRDMVILRSMGNVANNIRPEAVAKSALGIGATVNGGGMENLAGFSGKGPTKDGRLKPDVVAPGDCLLSAQRGSTAGYVCFSGTSMSTPTVAGAVTLVRDYFAKGFYPDGIAGGDASNPSTALVRAILAASGREMTGSRSHDGYYNGWGLPPQAKNVPNQFATTTAKAPGFDKMQATFPNTLIGWGRVTLDDALYFAGDSRRLVALDESAPGLATGERASYTLHVTGDQPLRVRLAWSDFPAATGAPKDLVNDLHLVVIPPAGPPLFGNNFNGPESIPGLPDQINVMEGVTIAAPIPGDYQVLVYAANVPMGPQPYALVATGGVSA